MACASTALIVGGGIAGLSCAIALTRVGVQCEVIEKGNPKEGASIAFSGRAASALVELGIYDLIHNAGTPFPHDSQVTTMRDAAGNSLSRSISRPTWPDAKEAVGIYRPTLIEIMIKVAIDLGVKIHQGTTFTKLENSANGVTVWLSTGNYHKYDFVVGADGINSATRKELFPSIPEPTYTGQWSIRWMAPGPQVQPESWYQSSLGRVGFYYLPEGYVYVPCVIDQPENIRLTSDEIYHRFSNLLDSMTAPAIIELRQRLHRDSDLVARPFRWILLSSPWYDNRTILIGDAAHATTSHMGMGGGMALEDSVVLAQCIRDAPTVDEAFKAFMKRRYERVRTVVNTSVELSNLEQQNAPPIERKKHLENAFAALSSPY
jgi:2-polyprenyl-6-methoxyphenol hydroxylase-like FAD-dependent oxidoreductase